MALNCTRRLVDIARRVGARIHVLHISTAEEMPFLARHKDVASVEATPHHLTLVAPDCYDRLGTLAQMNPPVRDAAHRDGIWWGLREGVVDVLGSDHAPHTLEEKAKTYPESPSGMTGVQTLVPIMLDHVNAGRLTLERFVDLSSAGPNRIFGTALKGRIAVGYDADLTVVDLKRRETITNRWIASKSGWTPYDGVTVTGWPVGTLVRGAVVMWEGDLVTPATASRCASSKRWTGADRASAAVAAGEFPRQPAALVDKAADGTSAAGCSAVGVRIFAIAAVVGAGQPFATARRAGFRIDELGHARAPLALVVAAAQRPQEGEGAEDLGQAQKLRLVGRRRRLGLLGLDLGLRRLHLRRRTRRGRRGRCGWTCGGGGGGAGRCCQGQ